MSLEAVNSMDSIDKINPIQQAYPVPVDKELFKTLDEINISRSNKNRTSKATMRKAKAEVQNQPNVNQELLDILVKYGNNPDGIPTLHYAIKMQDAEAVKLLLKHGVDANSHSQFTKDYEFHEPLTALEYAAYYGNLDIMNILINHGAKVNPELKFDSNGYLNKEESNRILTPLFFAAQNNQPKAIQLLVRRGAKINPFIEYGNNANVYVKDRFNWCQPLYAAVSSDKLEAFKMFKDLGADYITGIYQQPYYLHVACQRNAFHVLKEMLKNGCDPDIRNDIASGSSETPFIKAIQCGSYECCDLLMEYNVNVKAKMTPQQCDALSLIIYRLRDAIKIDLINKDFSLIKKIIRKGKIDINEKRGNCTLLHEAIWTKNMELMQLLLDLGADINCRDKNNQTLIDYVKFFIPKCPELIQWLIDHGAKE